LPVQRRREHVLDCRALVIGEKAALIIAEEFGIKSVVCNGGSAIIPARL
jgi:hypothetical protein